MKQIMLLLAVILVVSGFSFLNRMPDGASSESHDMHQTIVDVAEEAGGFGTLLTALDAADLIATLRQNGPFTVFAPTDEAFARLPEGTIEFLLKPENRKELKALLTYHVVGTEIRSTDLLTTTGAETLNGQSIPIGLSIEGANIVQTDIDASNGVIHIVDAVLMPERMMQRLMSNAVAEMIEQAINKGAPLYNHGDAAACRDIYEATAQTLIKYDQMPTSARQALQDAVREMKKIHDVDRQAWIMRHGLDRAYEILNHRSRMTWRQ